MVPLYRKIFYKSFWGTRVPSWNFAHFIQNSISSSRNEVIFAHTNDWIFTVTTSVTTADLGTADLLDGSAGPCKITIAL